MTDCGAFEPMIDAEENEIFSPKVRKILLQERFEEVGIDGDGLVTSCELFLMSAAGSCKRLKGKAGFQPIFDPSLLNYSCTIVETVHKITGESSSALVFVHQLWSQLSTTATTQEVVHEQGFGIDNGDGDCNAYLAPVHMVSLSLSGSLFDVEYNTTLVYQPLFAAQRGQIRRAIRAIQFMLLAEARSAISNARKALGAIATAAAAAELLYIDLLDRNQWEHVVVATVKSIAQHAAVFARSTVSEVVALGKTGQIRMKNGGKDGNTSSQQIASVR